MTLVMDGRATAKIVLPERTECELYWAQRIQEIEKNLHARNLKKKAYETQRKKQIDAMKTKAPDDEELAARELQTIIERIAGARMEIIRAENRKLPDGPCIVIGAELASMLGVGKEIDGLNKDGLICRVKKDNLILTGKRARGTLYAAYTFLESLGCRWVMPGPFGEIYPSKRTIQTEIDVIENPSHSQRYWWCTYGHAKGYKEWTLRTKGDFVKARGDPMVAQSHALAQPMGWGATRPEYQTNVVRKVKEKTKDENGKPVVKWVEKKVTGLPDDFYAMVNGKVSKNVPNMSNPKVWDMYAAYYIQYFNKNPNAAYVSASAEDDFVNDDRPATRELDSKEFDQFMGAFSATDRFWFFLNRVMEKVAKVHPKKKFGILVYSNNMAPPRIERIHPNMALVFAPLGISPLHHVRDPKSKTNRTYKEWLEDWMLMAKDAGAETYYYDYEPLGYCWNMAMICPRWAIIGKNYPWFHKLGLDGHTTQGYDDWASCGLNNYLMQRLYWNVDQDYHDIIRDYCNARFGKAADVMFEYYAILEKRMEEIPDLYSNEMWDNHLILTPEVRKLCRTQLEKAVGLADTDRSKAHVQTMVDLQASTDAMCDAIEYAHETGDFGGAAKKMAKVFEIRDKLNKLYPNFMNRTRLSEKQKAQYMTGGLYNQYLGFDQKIRSASASFVLPRYWKGMLDTRNHAFAMGYHKTKADLSSLVEQDVTICPDVRYGTQREMAAFFYRTDVKIPRSFRNKKVTLFFPSIIARSLQIWINGEAVEFDHGSYKDTTWRGGPTYFWRNYNHQQLFDISGYLKAGKRNTIAFRAFKSYDFGGTYRRVWLLADDPVKSD